MHSGRPVWGGSGHHLGRQRWLAHRLGEHLIRGAKRERLAAAITEVETCLQSWADRQKLERLNQVGEAMLVLYGMWCEERQKRKHARGWAEFHDLTIGCHRLFHGGHGRLEVRHDDRAAHRPRRVGHCEL